ncbi:UMP-CMP kinase, putative [Plasmodium malariae]|uniref:UMP-CMP kinase, putative n=1 Tax=Plasmodium malariae TaxID=5858 RepID=A0A1D3JKJ3_PLAMA|nr:UMP-CMP kinase, putative [Plasmodium malariae]SBT87081.1 UMP-CMP kinase, putative [Plasmodium malariae]
MNYKNNYVIIFSMIIVNFSRFFVENTNYLKRKKTIILYANRTNVYYYRGLNTFENTLKIQKLLRGYSKLKKSIILDKNKFYINKSLEEKFFANNTFEMSKDQPFVIFMLGGPGSGKGTQCKLIQDKFDFIHISAGECLREYLRRCENNEVDKKHQSIVEHCINNGEIVPVHITLELMKIKMENEIEKKKKKKEEKGQSKKRQEEEELSQKKQDKEEEKEEKKKSFSFKILDENVLLKNINIEEYNKKLKYENCIYENKEVLKILKKNKINEEAKYKFIIDGFPRNYDNFDGWMSIIGNYAYVHLCLFLYCDDDNMIERCINRGLISGRVDDNMDTLRKRFETHKNSCIPVINLF